MVVHVSAALGAARTKTWPRIDKVRGLAVELRATIWELAVGFAQWLGVAGDYVSFGEAEIWMHLHDARHKDHDKDFHCLLFLAGEFLRWAKGRSTALGVIRIDGLEQPHLSVLVNGSG